LVDPSLSDQQLEQLAIEVDRIEKVFRSLMEEQPLDFAMGFLKESPESKMGAKPKTKRREHVFLMKELMD
jgi:hypothetical protein